MADGLSTEKGEAGISVFFPAHNDGGTIASMVLSAILVLEPLACDHEVIVVNDRSTDYAEEILDRLERRYEQGRVISHDGNAFRLPGGLPHISQLR